MAQNMGSGGRGGCPRDEEGAPLPRAVAAGARAQPPPSSPDVPASELHELLSRKLAQCGVMFDFLDCVADLKGKEVKRAALNELVECVGSTRGVLIEPVYPDIIRMVSPLRRPWQAREPRCWPQGIENLKAHIFLPPCPSQPHSCLAPASVGHSVPPGLVPPCTLTSTLLQHVLHVLLPWPGSVPASSMKPLSAQARKLPSAA